MTLLQINCFSLVSPILLKVSPQGGVVSCESEPFSFLSLCLETLDRCAQLPPLVFVSCDIVDLKHVMGVPIPFNPCSTLNWQ